MLTYNDIDVIIRMSKRQGHKIQEDKTMEERIKENITAINNALSELKRIYNDKETTMSEMYKIMEYMRLLDITDFTETITN